MGQRRDDPIRLAPIEFLLQQAEYSSRHSQRVAGQRWGQVGRNEGCEFHRLAFVGRLSRNAPAVVEDPSHEKRELRPQVHGLFRRQAIAQDVQHRSQRPVGGPTITAGGYTTETAVSAIEAKLGDAVAFGRMFIANPDLPQAHPSWGAAERLRPFDGLWRRRTRLFMFSSFGSTGERRSWPMPSPRADVHRQSRKPQGHFFATIAGYCRFSHDNHFRSRG